MSRGKRKKRGKKMSFKEIMETIKRNWIISAVLCIVVGLLLVLFPGSVLESLCYILGGIAIAAGVIRVVRYFKEDHTYPVIFQSDLMVGLFSLGLGLFMITNPETVVGLIPTLFSIVIVGFGIANILRAVDAKKAGLDRWGILLALAILTVLAGWVILMNPFATMAATVTLIGACLIYEGVADIVTVLLVGKRIDAWRKSL